MLPPLAGRVTQLKVQLGERVEAGQPLVVIDSPDLATAYADYDRAKVLLALALKNRDRQRDLAKIGGAADKDLQQAETDYVTAEVELQRAEARLKQIGVEAETTNKSRTVTVVAPMAGSVIDLAVAPGAFWNDATAALMTRRRSQHRLGHRQCARKRTPRWSRKGQPVDVVFPAYPGEVVQGAGAVRQRRARSRHAPHQGAHRVRQSRHAAEAGHVRQCQLPAPAQNAPVVPTSALVLKDDANQVFVEVAPWTFEARDRRDRFPAGRPGRPQERRQGRRPRRRQGRSAAQ